MVARGDLAVTAPFELLGLEQKKIIRIARITSYNVCYTKLLRRHWLTENFVGVKIRIGGRDAKILFIRLNMSKICLIGLKI